MSIQAFHTEVGGPGLVIVVTPESMAVFKELVNRALNCWDSAPPEIKIFGDIVTEGQVLQDYANQT